MKKKSIYSLIAVVATFLATTISTSACYYFFYQPEEPKCLRDE